MILQFNLEKGVTYDIVAEGINDYYLSDIKTISADKDITKDIDFQQNQLIRLI